MMVNEIQIEYFKTVHGELILGAFEEQLCLCDWRYREKREAIDNRIKRQLNAAFKESEANVLSIAKSQLNEYLEGERKQFDLPILMIGSDFQKKVWNQLLGIPFGKTENYRSLSQTLGDVKAIRAVATANGANALSIIIPCHRVIGSNGEMVGYAGGVAAKKSLLLLEGALDESQLSLF